MGLQRLLFIEEEEDLPSDYEVCSLCGFDHEYDVCYSLAGSQIREAHKSKPSSNGGMT